jgi:hypothetical protein
MAPASSCAKRASAARIPSSVSNGTVVVKRASWSARKARSSAAGSSRRAATIARHARPVPMLRSRGWVSNGMPYWRKRR